MAVVGKGKGDQSEYLHAVLDVYCASNLVKDSKELQAIFSRPSERFASQYCIKILYDNSDKMGYFVSIQMNEEKGQKSVDQVPNCDERNTLGGDRLDPNTLTIDGGGGVEKFDLQTHIDLKEITADEIYHDSPTTDLAKESMPLADCAHLVDASADTCLTDTSMDTYNILKSTT